MAQNSLERGTMPTELEKIVNDHGRKLEQHDKELSRLSDLSLEMQKTINDGLTRVDESNRFLREQNTSILGAVLNRNEKSDDRNYEMKMLDKNNMWKMIFGIGASAGAVFAIVLEIIKYFGGK